MLAFFKKESYLIEGGKGQPQVIIESSYTVPIFVKARAIVEVMASSFEEAYIKLNRNHKACTNQPTPLDYYINWDDSFQIDEDKIE